MSVRCVLHTRHVLLLRAILTSTVFALAVACGGGSGQSQPSAQPPIVAADADIALLFMGNSHTSSNNLTGMVAAMVSAVRPGKSVANVVAPGGMFLEERLHDAPSMTLLRSQRWTAVVLQAQKYSTSGLYTYSTAEAEELVRIARAAGSLPVMFPEWPQRGIDETQRIYDLHVSIAQRATACVAPIGQAWDLALVRHPSLVLHASDGNHSAPAGAFLAALVLFTTLTNESPLRVPDLPQFGVASSVQRQLRDIAAETVAMIPARQCCAADPLI
jgi:hypothetical protein